MEHYTYDDADVLCEYDADGTETVRYVLAGLDRPVRRTNSGAVHYYYHADTLGSVTEISDGNGALVEYCEYDVYGTPRLYGAAGNLLSASSVGNTTLFTGRRYERESGVYHYRARFYSPRLGRFLQPDPIGYAGGINIYAYCENNPTVFIDPYGEATFTVFGNSRNNSKAEIAQRRASSSAYSAGHVWMEYTYTYPNGKGSTINRGNYPPEKGGYQSDSSRNATADFSHSFDVPDSKTGEVVKELVSYDDFGPLNHNCVDSLEKVPDKAGIEHPDFGWPSDPRKVEDWLSELKKQDI